MQGPGKVEGGHGEQIRDDHEQKKSVDTNNDTKNSIARIMTSTLKPQNQDLALNPNREETQATWRCFEDSECPGLGVVYLLSLGFGVPYFNTFFLNGTIMK